MAATAVTATAVTAAYKQRKLFETENLRNKSACLCEREMETDGKEQEPLHGILLIVERSGRSA